MYPRQEHIGKLQLRLEVLLLMRGDYMTCMVICLTGVWTGMARTRLLTGRTIEAPVVALTAWYAAGRGTVTVRPCARPIGATAFRAFGATMLASGLSAARSGCIEYALAKQRGWRGT